MVLRSTIEAEAQGLASSTRVADRDALNVECLTTASELEQIADEWRALFDRVPDALPFATYEWAAAWWANLRRGAGPLRDTLQLFVVRDGTGQAVAIAPMMHTSLRIAGIPVLRILQPIGADPNLTEVRGMLVRGADEAAAFAALAQHVYARGGQSWVQWCGARRESATLDTLRAIRPLAVNKETPAFVLALAGSWDDFRKTFPRNLRESLRKCYNSLARDSHEWTLHVVDRPDEVPAAVERLIELHGVRASRTDTIRHRDCFDEPEARRFLHDVAARFAACGVLRIFQLRIGSDVVATRMGFVFGDRMYLYYSGYDAAWGRYSVMTTVVAEALRYAIEAGITSVNLSTGGDESKLRWRPTAVDYIDACSVAGGVYSRLMHRALDPDARARLKRLATRG